MNKNKEKISLELKAVISNAAQRREKSLDLN